MLLRQCLVLAVDHTLVSYGYGCPIAYYGDQVLPIGESSRLLVKVGTYSVAAISAVSDQTPLGDGKLFKWEYDL